jgi:hypothetical protein
VRRVVVAGALANKPFNGGEAWVRLNWLLGLRRLGLEVHFVEQLDAASCVDVGGSPVAPERSRQVAYARSVLDRFALADHATLLIDDGPRTVGRSEAELLELIDSADALVNISGHLRAPALLARARRRVLVDVDPGYTQMWHLQGLLGTQLADHDLHLTVAAAIGRPGCSIPTAGVRWRPVQRPVVLDEWPVVTCPAVDRFTTVASWRGGHGRVEHAGRAYGLKAHEFRKLLELPRRVPQRFEIALDIHLGDHADLAALREHGWHVADPRRLVPDPLRFRRYVQASGAECSAVQGIYVETGSAWFSDRSAAYLASGKPVLVQDTGLRDHLPVGEGLVTFTDLAGAVAGAERIAADYERHARAARDLAERHFDSDRVLTEVLAVVADVAPRRPGGG